MAKETLTLFGTAVSCAQCLANIKNGLETLHGIFSLSADVKADTLQIDYDSDIIDENGIRAKLRALGFGAKMLYCIC
ncbi:MAG: heavy-metal-associated domain-containing protein [Firmicutes bacterium]|nr:heavy-metal-associated domain-containing protein [Bacillota bacterium]